MQCSRKYLLRHQHRNAQCCSCYIMNTRSIKNTIQAISSALPASTTVEVSQCQLQQMCSRAKCSSFPLKCPVIHAICSIAHCVIQAKCSIAQCVIQAKCSSAHQPPVDGFNPPTVPVSCPSGQCSRPFLQLHSINLKWMCYTSILQCPAPVAGVPLIIFLFQHYFRTNPQFLNNPVNLLTCSMSMLSFQFSVAQSGNKKKEERRKEENLPLL